MEQNEKNVQQKRSIFAKEWTKYASFSALFISIVTLFLPLVLETVKNDVGEKIETTLYLWDMFVSAPLAIYFVLMLLLLIGSVPLLLLGKRKNNFSMAGALLLFLGATFIFLVPNVYQSVTYCYKSELLVGLALAFSFAIVSGAFALVYSYQQVPMNIKGMSEDAILVAAAFALNFLKIPMGPTGGSINLQMLPLMIIALRRGPLEGFICGGLVFGVLTCFTDNYGWACFPFDYLIGFGSVCALGFFRNFIFAENQEGYNLKGEIFIAVGSILTALIRMIGSCASSMILWGADLGYALGYNAVYILPSAGFAMIILMALYGPLLKINRRFPVISE
ncbi:MAG: energy-coupled thiamine transporter ThiT [Bacilli bacterium]|nr:energy-coupled thiamine transporter ThiT [Bacilli bacterium]